MKKTIKLTRLDRGFIVNTDNVSEAYSQNSVESDILACKLGKILLSFCTVKNKEVEITITKEDVIQKG